MPHRYYRVSFVDDVEMPDDKDWLIVEVDDEVYCVVRESRLCPAVLEEAWAGYRRLADIRG